MVDHRLCDFVTRQRRQGSRLSKVGPRKLSCPESVAILQSIIARVDEMLCVSKHGIIKFLQRNQHQKKRGYNDFDSEQ